MPQGEPVGGQEFLVGSRAGLANAPAPSGVATRARLLASAGGRGEAGRSVWAFPNGLTASGGRAEG